MRRAEQITYAKQLLENPVFVEACQKLEANAINRAVAAKPDDNNSRLEALACIRAIRAFRSHCEALTRNTEPTQDVSA